jgi:hypothetical protein
MISKKDKTKQSTNPADFAFNPNGEQEDVGEVQAFHLLLMLLRLAASPATFRADLQHFGSAFISCGSSLTNKC